MVVCPKHLFRLMEESDEISKYQGSISTIFHYGRTMTLTMTRMYFPPMTPKRKNDDFTEFWKPELEQLSSEQILHWAFDSYSPRLALATSFEPEGCVLLAMLSKITPEITVVCDGVDFRTRRSQEMAGRFRAKYGIRVMQVDSILENNENDTLESYPIPKFDAILCGMRRQNHVGLKVLGRHAAFGIPIISPLARWTREAVVDKLKRDGIARMPYLR